MPDERELVALVRELAAEIAKDAPASPALTALLVRAEEITSGPETPGGDGSG